ncbi:unnamed protein product [Cylindrotheca closterium]|uniref:Uncharacterized protein n=1 Tax=Cylindrotheca closterium TaxID=2856 RepID=A0AAD2FKI5_9STRA|nr:unnamed protein product [Cylindrotheca closterium]
MFPAKPVSWNKHPMHFNPLLKMSCHVARISILKSKSSNHKKVAPHGAMPTEASNRRAEMATMLDQAITISSNSRTEISSAEMSVNDNSGTEWEVEAV